MKKVLGLLCAAAVLFTCNSASADWRCWSASDGSGDCVYDKNYNRYGVLKNQVENVDFNKYYGENAELEKVFGAANMAKIRDAAARDGKTVNDYLADKLTK